MVGSYLRALAAYDPEAVPGFVSFEGYLAGRLAAAGVAGCGAQVTRDCFLGSLRGSDAIDIDGFELRYGDADNQGSDAVFLTRIGAGRHATGPPPPCTGRMRRAGTVSVPVSRRFRPLSRRCRPGRRSPQPVAVTLVRRRRSAIAAAGSGATPGAAAQAAVSLAGSGVCSR